MAEEETQEEQEQPGRVFVGFHQLGGVHLVAENVRLEPNDAFALAGQLIAHATLFINNQYMEQAMARQALANGSDKLILPPGLN